MTQARANNPVSMERAQEIARRTLAGDYDLLLACRDLVSLKERLPNVPYDLMNIFVGVASEVDDLPIGAERRQWASEALKAKDIEAGDYRERVRDVVTAALRALLACEGH